MSHLDEAISSVIVDSQKFYRDTYGRVPAQSVAGLDLDASTAGPSHGLPEAQPIGFPADPVLQDLVMQMAMNPDLAAHLTRQMMPPEVAAQMMTPDLAAQMVGPELASQLAAWHLAVGAGLPGGHMSAEIANQVMLMQLQLSAGLGMPMPGMADDGEREAGKEKMHPDLKDTLKKNREVTVKHELREKIKVCCQIRAFPRFPVFLFFVLYF